MKRIIGRKLGRGRKRDRASERKRKKRSEGSEGSDSEGKGEGWFEEEGIKRMDLLKLPRVLRAQVGEIKYAKLLRDGNLLIGCNLEVKLMGVCIVKVKNTARVGKKGVNGSKGVIVGVQVTTSMQDLVENLKLRNGEVKGVRGMTKERL